MITVQDIHEKEFKRKMRGYDEIEVDAFLDLIAEDYSNLLREVETLREQAAVQKPEPQTVAPAAAPAQAASSDATVRSLEATLRDTLVIAQRTADETVAEAQKKAKLIVQGAEDRAALLQYDAGKELERLTAQIEQTKAAAISYRAQLRQFAEAQLEMLAEDEVQADGAEQG